MTDLSGKLQLESMKTTHACGDRIVNFNMALQFY